MFAGGARVVVSKQFVQFAPFAQYEGEQGTVLSEETAFPASCTVQWDGQLFPQVCNPIYLELAPAAPAPKRRG